MLHLQDLNRKTPVFQAPLAKQKIWTRGGVILTVALVNTPGDRISLSINSNVADAEALPVSEQAYQILSGLATADMETQSLISRLDMQEAREPVHLHLGRTSARSRFAVLSAKIESGEDRRGAEVYSWKEVSTTHIFF